LLDGEGYQLEVAAVGDREPNEANFLRERRSLLGRQRGRERDGVDPPDLPE
jgi:hypothetical protein